MFPSGNVTPSPTLLSNIALIGKDSSCIMNLLRALIGICSYSSSVVTFSSLASQVLAELKEYATEVDVDFVRKAVRAIGRCAIKVEVRSV